MCWKLKYQLYLKKLKKLNLLLQPGSLVTSSGSLSNNGPKHILTASAASLEFKAIKTSPSSHMMLILSHTFVIILKVSNCTGAWTVRT